MKTIAIDVDDVLALSAEGFISYSNQRWGTTLKPSDYDEHWAKMWSVTNEEVEQRAREFHASGITKSYHPISDGESVLAELSKKFTLVITTSRRLQLQTETTEWIQRHYNGLFADIHYAGMWDTITDHSAKATKLELCKSIGADYLIDDQLKHCIAVDSAGIKAILFGDYSWNQTNALPHTIYRAKNWNAVRDYFDNR